MKIWAGELKDHVILESVRGGDLQLRCGEDGKSFVPIIHNGDYIPAKKSLQIKIRDAQRFALYQGSSFDGYLGSILLDNKSLQPDDTICFTVDIDASKFISISLIKDGQVLEESCLSRPYHRETLHNDKYPYVEVSDDETEFKA